MGTTMTIISLLLFAIGVFCYAVKELQSHGKLRGQGPGLGFWDERSWMRKWKIIWPDGIPSKKEAFWGSSRWFVFVTDGYHLMQFFYIKLFVASIIIYRPWFGYWDAGLYLGVWYLVFVLMYNGLQKKKK